MIRPTLLALTLVSGLAVAQPVVLTSPATINPGDTLISGVPIATAEITVRGTTLTVNGRHTIASLAVERSAGNQPGIVTHAIDFRYVDGGQDRYGMHLLVSGAVNVQGASGNLVASRIDAAGRGFNYGEGPGAGTGGTSIECAGGGGYGGGGGRSRIDCSNVPGGPVYGSITAPTDFGSGGGRDNNAVGGRGGGCVWLDLAGALTLDGSVVVSGAGFGGAESAAGAGGSVFITCGSLQGAGSITANGGGANAAYSGGGAGGRIAVYPASNAFTGTMQAVGGAGYYRGGAGTALLKVGSNRAVVVIDNGGATGLRENTEMPGLSAIDADVVVRGGGRIGPRAGVPGMALTINGDLTVEVDGALFADGYGYASDRGPGAGVGGPSVACAGGGGHGGAGGRSRFDCGDVAGGVCNDSVTEPQEMGSGGGRDNNALGGAGGGAIGVFIAGTFTHNGSATAAGLNLTGAEAGAGAGGSIWIECGVLAGSGSFAADGGNGNAVYSGGGGGGRVAVHTTSSTFTGSFSALGGDGYSRGGAGTSFLKIGTESATIWIDNGGATDERETTEFYGPTVLNADVVVRGGARVGPRREQTNFVVSITGDLTVETGGALFADGRGFPSGAGPGAGTGGAVYECTAGGGHGGAGGWSRFNCSNVPGGATYGSITQPIALGSGGGRDNNALGGAGGGAIRMSIGGRLTVDGVATAAGLGAAGAEAGGGAGGSIWINCGEFVGAGSVIAHGGGANAVNSGGGGGGRIAVYAASGSTFSGTFRASGGPAYNSGGAGTALLKSGAARAVVYIDNGGLGGLRETTELTEPTTLDADLVVRGNARFGPRREQTNFGLTLSGNLTVEPDGVLYADGRGFPSGAGPGAGVGAANIECAAGGGYGGAGGWSRFNCSNVPGGPTYGSITQPGALGSGGGRDNSALGGAGGGAIRMSIGGRLTVDGVATAAGLGADGAEAGGGAGGSIWIDCGELTGTGSVIAHGGGAHTVNSGGGGGGRIAVYAAAGSSFSGIFRASGGAAYNSGGAGTALLKSGAARAVVYIDNGGLGGLRETTEIAEPTVVDADVVVRGAARLGPRRGQINFNFSMTGDMIVEADGAVYADGRGYASDAGPGAGVGASNIDCAGGGGYGGAGGWSRDTCNNSSGGVTYGSITQPGDLGSGGGRDNSALGGAGGGAIVLSMGGTLTVAGTVSANGDSGASESGGGAGGSIRIYCGQLAGDGSVIAHGGGAHTVFAGGGGGGRIAVYAATGSTFSGTFRASGGNALNPGGAGTALLKNGADRAVIFIDNGGLAGTRETTEITGPTWLDADMIVRGSARLGPRREQPEFDLSLTGDLTVDADGEIYGDGRGFPSGTGPGAGTGAANIDCAGGGGYGGRGGNSRSDCNNSPGGPAYGDPSNPVEMGSGGGRDNAALGGAGGGAVRLTVDGSVFVNGRIGADGASGVSESGGGSGGSVFITCGGIGGAGTVTARGGGAHTIYAGGGGGGRIAIFTCNNLLPPSSLIVTGGTGVNNGQPGSTSFGSSSIVITSQPVGGAYRGGDFFQIGVQATGDGPLSYQWRRRDALGVFLPLTEGQEGIYTEVNSNTLFVSGVTCAAAGDYDCLICDACGCFPSNVATLTIDAPGDFNMDGGIDGSDVEAFFAAWEGGDDRGDINLDGGIDGADVEFFFSRWEQGC